MLIITPQIKDKVLERLLSADNPSFEFDYKDSKTQYDISPDYVELILTYIIHTSKNNVNIICLNSHFVPFTH